MVPQTVDLIITDTSSKMQRSLTSLFFFPILIVLTQ